MTNPMGETSCKVCGQSFPTEQQRQQHEREFHPESEKPTEDQGTRERKIA